MHNILQQFSKSQLLAIVTSLILFVLMGLSLQRSPTSAAPLSGVVIEETLADNETPAPAKPEDPQPAWTAWSG